MVNKINGRKSHILMPMLACIHGNFCLLVNREKEIREQLILDEKRLNDKDFKKKYHLTKDEYKNKDFKLAVSIRTDELGKFVAELYDLTEKQITSMGYNYTTLGYEVAKLNIHDIDFHAGEYDPEYDRIDFVTIDYSAKKKNSVTAMYNNDYYITSVE